MIKSIVIPRILQAGREVLSLLEYLKSSNRHKGINLRNGELPFDKTRMNHPTTNFNGAIRSFSARPETDTAAGESEEHYRLLVQSVKDYAIYTLDPDGNVTSWNSGAENIKGYTTEEIIGKHFSIFYTKNDRQLGRPGNALKHATLEERYEEEAWRVRKDGTLFWASIVITALRDESDNLEGFAKVVRDLTHRKQAEEALRRSETRFRSIFENAALGIILLDSTGKLIESNSAVVEMLGYNREELQDIIQASTEPPRLLDEPVARMEELKAGIIDSYSFEKPLHRKDSHVVWGRLAVSLIRGEGDPEHILLLIEDISDRRNMQSELSELQRRLMESREAERIQLARALHDGPLQNLYGVSYQLEAFANEVAIESNSSERVSVDEIQSNLRQIVGRLRNICGDLRPPTLVPFGLEKAIRSHVAKLQEERPHVAIELNITPDKQTLPEMVRLALYRIYRETVINAIRHADASRISVNFKVGVQEISLEVADNGKGFDVPKRWIEYARQGQMGLVEAAERAESIGGILEVVSSPGQGTLVRVTVPYGKHFSYPNM